MKVILIADPDRNHRMMMLTALSSANYQVLIAETGVEVLNLCTASAPDLVIIDPRLPGLEKESPERFLDCLSRQPVILISHAAQPRNRLPEPVPNVCEHLLKPVHLTDLMERVRFHLSAGGEYVCPSVAAPLGWNPEESLTLIRETAGQANPNITQLVDRLFIHLIREGLLHFQLVHHDNGVDVLVPDDRHPPLLRFDSSVADDVCRRIRNLTNLPYFSNQLELEGFGYRTFGGRRFSLRVKTRPRSPDPDNLLITIVDQPVAA